MVSHLLRLCRPQGLTFVRHLALKGPSMPAQGKPTALPSSAYPGAMATRTTWPSVTLTITPAVFRGHINPRPAAECSVDPPRRGCGRENVPVCWVPIGATAGAL